MKPENRFYVYIYFDPSRGMEPFYVGKGTGKRAEGHLNRKDKHPFTNRLKHLKKIEVTPVIEKHENLIEQEAFDLEKALITQIGRKDLGLGPLLNLTDGGEGSSGWIPSEETRKKYSEYHKGRPKTEEQKQKMSAVKMGTSFSDSHKQSMSEAWTKRKAAGYKHGGRPKGSKMSDEARKRLSEAKKGKKLSPESTQKRLQTMKEKYGDGPITYNSKFTKGVNGEWSDAEFLNFAKSKLYIGVGGDEMKEAIDKRMNAVIEMLEKYEESQSIQ